MKAEAIPYHQTKHFSQFILKYISGDTSLRALFNRTPSIESFKAQITEKKSQNFNRNALVSSLVDPVDLSAATEPPKFEMSIIFRPFLFK